MNRIRLLSEQVVNQIAAGEVIERPASVVKELVENSLDAGARQVRIAFHAGGRSAIAVTDDGWGMSRDDALLCLERHGTSKIAAAEDIMSIHTLGFRGEAIPSIAAVSRFTLTTREHDAASGTRAVTELCHKHGIRYVPYYLAQREPVALAEAHPDWRCVNSKGKPTSYFCVNTPYRELVCKRVAELVKEVGVDGVFFDMFHTRADEC